MIALLETLRFNCVRACLPMKRYSATSLTCFETFLAQRSAVPQSRVKLGELARTNKQSFVVVGARTHKWTKRRLCHCILCTCVLVCADLTGVITAHWKGWLRFFAFVEVVGASGASRERLA